MTQREREQGQLIEFAEQIARGWAEQLKVGASGVEWVAVKGGARTPISASGARAVILHLEHDAGIAFVLGSPGVMDLLFVVTRKSKAYSVNISNNAKPWDRSERHDVRPEYAGDMKELLVAARKYVRKDGVSLP
jgi:hypothetical protein